MFLCDCVFSPYTCFSPSTRLWLPHAVPADWPSLWGFTLGGACLSGQSSSQHAEVTVACSPGTCPHISPISLKCLLAKWHEHMLEPVILKILMAKMTHDRKYCEAVVQSIMNSKASYEALTHTHTHTNTSSHMM